ncbi:MAG: pentapeptide repeat-containing protein [Bacteroidales bacterium]|nr:pentapeptide repeat-containing protein [Bacteroidales bacterium]
MEAEEMSKLVTQKHIEDVDLSESDIDGFDFSGCEINNVVFASVTQQNKEIRGVNFNAARLTNVSFEGATLINCDFDGFKTNLTKVSFKRCTLLKCRFRNSVISWSDFRYTEVNLATFEGSRIDFCDFYRAFFVGVVIFRKSRISNSSLYYTYFDEGATIRKENLVDGRILQQDKIAYTKFLVDWNTNGTGQRKNEQNRLSDWSPDASLKSRFGDAEDIYKTLNGLWTSKGFLGEANWAYVKGKKMERRRLMAELTDNQWTMNQKFKNLIFIAWNYLCDFMFGYGESMKRMILSYILVVFIFAYLYYASPDISLPSYARAIGISLKNMVALSSAEVENVSPLVDFLNIIQTTFGILVTGIFGFILGNKIRNQ